jgi:radical SAM superfamily enzyme YgiQ (UPF0313 family)
MRVLLISANQCATPYPVYPIGLDYVAGAIADRHEVRILDLYATGGATTLPAAVNEFAPDVVGLSLRNVDSSDGANVVDFTVGYRAVVRAIRAATNAPLVLGGSAFNIYPCELLNALQADFGIYGEGEVFSVLLDRLAAGRDPGDVPGLVRRDGRAAAPHWWPGSIARSFQRHGAVAAPYLRLGGMLNLQTKRGCPFRCVYCTYPLIEGAALRRFDPQEVAETALALQHAGAAYLFITDSSFNADVEHNLAVAAAFRRVGLSIPWGAFFTPIPMPADYYARLAGSGLSHVEYGTDALDDTVLQALGKPFRVNDVVQNHRQARQAGLHVAHYFTLGAPGETAVTLAATLDQADRIGDGAFFFFCGVRVYPGTEIHARAVAEGQLRAEEDLLSPRFYRSSALTAGAMVETTLAKANGRRNWVVGPAWQKVDRIVNLLHRRGRQGPLWEGLLD